MDDRGLPAAGRGRLDRLALGVVRAVRADFGCLLIAIVFLLLMALTVIYSDLITPPPHNPFV
jgi:hypothetical protein